MKKLLAFLFLIIIIISAGCGLTEHENIEIDEKFHDDIFSQEVAVSYAGYTDFEKEAINSEILPESCQIKIRELQTDLLRYLNEEYKVKWTAPDIKGYSTIISEEVQNSVLECKAFYYKGSMYFDSDFFSSDTFLEDDLSQYVLTHELIHYLYDVNTGEHGFYLENENGERLGTFLEEAFVDDLAVKYCTSKGAKSQITNSKYKHIATAIDALSISCPDIFKYFFNKDINGLEKYLNKMIAKRVVICGSAGRKFFFMIDCCLLYPTENNQSRLVTFLIEMTPKTKADNLKKCLDGVFILPQNFKSYMR